MSKKGTNKLLRLLFLWLGGVLICSQLTAQDLQVLLDDTRDCNQNTYCLSIQLKATSVPKQIGTSSIFLQYNPTALAYATYMSSHFDGSDQCIQGQATAWDVQTFDATSAPGYFNLTMTLLTNQFSCPAIEGELIEVGVLCFDVIEEQQSADIKILANNTSFNSHLPNTGEKLHPTGKMGYSDTPKTLKCTGASVDCSQLKELWEETTIEIPITSCEEHTSFCTGISFNNRGAYELMVNDQPTEAIENCEEENVTRFYTYSSLLQLDKEGTFEVVNWDVNGTNYNGDFKNREELIRQLNNWDVQGNWRVDPTLNAIIGGKTERQYGLLQIKNINKDLSIMMALNKKVNSHTAAISLPEGVHTLTATNTYTNCKDELTVVITCKEDAAIRKEAVKDFALQISRDTALCLTNIINASDFIEDCSEQQGTASNLLIDNATNCMNLVANSVGKDEFCLFICDENDNCNNLTLTVEVVEHAGPILRDDRISVMINESKTIEVTRNDAIPETINNFEVPYSRTSGTLDVDAFNYQIVYTPAHSTCGIQDSFQYEIVTEVGTSRATVYVDVLCEEITVFSGFSPNGDGINDYFQIMGIENFEENEIVIFNNRGNEVFSKVGYQNGDGWDGTWKGKDLPDGTYYYMLNVANQPPMSGYVQLRR